MNKRILFVDDDQSVLDALGRMLRPQRHVWDFVGISDPRMAWVRLHEGRFDAVVTDMSMPGMDGLEFLERIKRSDGLKELPVVMLTGVEDRSLKRRALDLGAVDLLNKPIDPDDLVARIRNVLRLKEYDDQLKAYSVLLERTVQDRTAQLRQSRIEVIWRLGKAAEQRDDATGDHVIRIGCASRIIAETLEMENDFLDTIFVAAPLHDVGKIGIPEPILRKPTSLTEEEWEVMKQHCVIGSKILQEDPRSRVTLERCLKLDEAIPNGGNDNPMLEMAAKIALFHHEKWDGSGYPMQLAGELIPIEARIVAVADVFDALTSYRPYRSAQGREKALEIVEKGVGSHFDPDVYAAFEASLPKIKIIQEWFADEVDLVPVFDEVHDETDPVCRR